MFRCGPVNPSIRIIPNINVTKAFRKLYFFVELLKKAAVISVCSLSSFIEAQNKIHT